MIFRIFYKLSFLGRFAADVILAVFLICLLFPILPATGLTNYSSGSTSFNPKYFSALITDPILSDIIFALAISFCLALFLVITALTIAYFSFQSFTGKFTLLGLVSFFVLIPDSISFLIGAPFIAIFGKKNFYLLTYASSFSWGLAVALLGAYSFFHGIRKSEIQTLHMLGADHPQILTSYIFPRAIPYMVYGSLALSCLFSLQGLYTFQQISGRKSLLTYHLIRPQEFFNDPGPGSAVYLILLSLSLLGSIFIIKYASIEFKLAKSLDKTGYSKKVRRRKPKRKAKKKTKKKENSTESANEKKAVTEETENQHANNDSESPLEQEVPQEKETEAVE